MLFEHDFYFPAVCIVFQDFSISKRKIRAQKHFQGVTDPEFSFSLLFAKMHDPRQASFACRGCFLFKCLINDGSALQTSGYSFFANQLFNIFSAYFSRLFNKYIGPKIPLFRYSGGNLPAFWPPGHLERHELSNGVLPRRSKAWGKSRSGALECGA